MPYKSMLLAFLLSGGVIALAGAMRSSQSVSDDTKTIAAALDAFHDAASKADGDRYFAQFAPDGVFLGTDATERWNLDQFKAFAKPFFDKGQGWTYVPVAGKRFITIADDGATAWFDELLSNDKYGTCRGSGVLRKSGDAWKITQYNLSFMIPNDVAKEVVALIKSRSP